MSIKDFLTSGFFGVGAEAGTKTAETAGKIMNIIGATALVIGTIWFISKVKK